MSANHENLHQDTGMPEPPLPPTEMGVLWDEITRTNALIKDMRQMIFRGLRELAADLSLVEKKVKSFEERAAVDHAERTTRQHHLDRLLWAGLGLAALHLALEAARLLWRRMPEAG